LKESRVFLALLDEVPDDILVVHLLPDLHLEFSSELDELTAKRF